MEQLCTTLPTYATVKWLHLSRCHHAIYVDWAHAQTRNFLLMASDVVDAVQCITVTRWA
jgi:hypothetical protein